MKFFAPLLFLLSLSPAFAATEQKTTEKKAGICEDEECKSYSEWARRWSWVIGPKYVFQSNDRADTAFNTNGFPSPKKKLPGLNFELLRHCDHGWLFGIDFSWFGTERDSSNFEAEYRASTVGVKGGYDVLHGKGDSSLLLAGGLGLAGTKLTVFSTVRDGERSSASLYLEPSVSYYYRFTKRFRLGARASYLATLGDSSDSKGDNLGVTQIAPKGFSAALLFNIGRFEN